MNLKNNLTLTKLNLSDQECIDFVHHTYLEAFPLSERRPFDLAINLYEDPAQKFTILIARKDEQMLGFFTFWDLGDFIYAEHFAITPQARNGGIGKDVMELFLKQYNKPIILEVELPTTILSDRRIGFYQRLGFRLWEDIKYYQPPYTSEGGSIPMKLMSYGDIDLVENYISIKYKIYKHAYNC